MLVVNVALNYLKQVEKNIVLVEKLGNLFFLDHHIVNNNAVFLEEVVA